jgi:hypothetical protein
MSRAYARPVRNWLFANPVAIPGGLAGFFKEAGLVEVKEQSLTIRMDFPNFDDYWKSFQGGQGTVGKYFTDLAPDLKERIKEAVRDAVIQVALGVRSPHGFGRSFFMKRFAITALMLTVAMPAFAQQKPTWSLSRHLTRISNTSNRKTPFQMIGPLTTIAKSQHVECKKHPNRSLGSE